VSKRESERDIKKDGKRDIYIERVFAREREIQKEGEREKKRESWREKAGEREKKRKRDI
jgi:hypothetical protein